MKYFQTLLAISLTSLVASAPTAGADWGNWGSWSGYGKDHCLSQQQAESIVAQYISILEHTDPAAANATAQSLLSDNYQEISDSILSLEGLPLGGVTFQGKQEYITGVLYAPPVQGINTLEILVAGCTKILWYWKFTDIGSAKYEVKGFNLLATDSNGQVEQVNLEFNAIAWGLDTGYTLTFPPTKT